VRIVLDTNILISALWTPMGLEAQIVDLAIQGAFTPVATFLTWREYASVLARPKFAAYGHATQALLQRLEARVEWHAATGISEAALDPSDNLFLACAAAAEARYLITGNLKHYPSQYARATVCNARRFLHETGLTSLSPAPR
jgi:putative PIN family toxin of toxin-antitoxin system